MNLLGPIFLLGATAVGKSDVALEMARTLPELKGRVAILALDAMQVYRGADVGTGKASAAERGEIPHGGLDLAEIGEKFDAADYVRHTLGFMREQEAAGRRVLAVGGTGLYFRALTRGLCEAPRGSEALRAELAALPVAALRERLRRLDPEMLARVDAANPRRLARALEVMETTGRSLRAWQEETTTPAVTAFTAFCLQREKADLDARIERRIGAMFAAGWVEEVRELVARHGAERVKAFPAIGYRQIAEMLEGKTSTEAARRDILTATRQYARRQLTWFRREPTLRPVMLSDSPLLPAVLRVLS